MARYFFDSSALAKLYQAETGSAKVEAVFREPNRSIIISRLTVVEISSIFARRVRMGESDCSGCDISQESFSQ
jgi:PIN domain nuclease of toxin-antitoxin system